MPMKHPSIILGYGQNNISLANNHCASYPIIAYMSQTNDTERLAYSFKEAKATKKYEGEIPEPRII